MQFGQLKRREFITLFGGAAAWPLAVSAQQQEGMRRIGVLMSVAQTDAEGQRSIAAFLESLEQMGWVHGRNVQIERRWGGGDRDRIQRNATELVALRPDVILSQATPSVTALHGVTRSIPIVFVNVSDPLGSGFVESLAHPGSNITGFTNFEPSMGGKWLGLIKEIAPHVTRVALMRNPDTSPQASAYLPSLESAALSLALQLITVPVHINAEIERAFAAFGNEAGCGLILLSDVFTLTNRELIVRLADQYRLPAVYPFREFVKSGGLLFYGVDLVLQFRQAASYVDRILNAEKAADLPVQAPTKFELIVNGKTAASLGLTIPPTLLALADEVIE
jgi:putative ABC transport system substrate-binding protein